MRACGGDTPSDMVKEAAFNECLHLNILNVPEVRDRSNVMAMLVCMVDPVSTRILTFSLS